MAWAVLYGRRCNINWESTYSKIQLMIWASWFPIWPWFSHLSYFLLIFLPWKFAHILSFVGLGSDPSICPHTWVRSKTTWIGPEVCPPDRIHCCLILSQERNWTLSGSAWPNPLTQLNTGAKNETKNSILGIILWKANGRKKKVFFCKAPSFSMTDQWRWWLQRWRWLEGGGTPLSSAMDQQWRWL